MSRPEGNRTADFTLPWVKLDGLHYVQLIALESGLRDHAEGLDRAGRHEAADEVRYVADRIARVYDPAEGQS